MRRVKSLFGILHHDVEDLRGFAREILDRLPHIAS
mgnify:CR=1 FL=1|jgi:hypothetical protein